MGVGALKNSCLLIQSTITGAMRIIRQTTLVLGLVLVQVLVPALTTLTVKSLTHQLLAFSVLISCASGSDAPTDTW